LTGPKIDPPAVETHAAFAERSGATALVAQRLMDDIRQGVWRPGDKLPTERQLAANLGLSRSAIREALRALEILGLIQVRQGSGVFVSSLSAEQLLTPLRFFISLDAGNIEALFEARINLEATVAGLAAERASEEELAQIRAALKSPSGRIGEIEPFLEADVYFHQLIAKAAHNAILERIVSSLSVLGRASREITAHVPGVVETSARDHQLILSALEAREPEIARAAMGAHLRNVRDAYRRQFCARYANEDPRPSGEK